MQNYKSNFEGQIIYTIQIDTFQSLGSKIRKKKHIQTKFHNKNTVKEKSVKLCTWHDFS